MLCVMIRLGPILVTVEDARHDIVGVHLSILLTPEMSSGMCLWRSRRCPQQGCICHESLICG